MSEVGPVGRPAGPPEPGPFDVGLLERYQAEVLRWNRQMNLVSRRNPEERLAGLVRQSVAAALALPGVLEPLSLEAAAVVGGRCASHFRKLEYIDIGSGCGVPGVVWHVVLGRTATADAGGAGPVRDSVFVESRAKRAWFLDRCVRHLGLQSARAVTATWGEGESFLSALPDHADDEGPTLWLLSLQALRLTDPELISGWRQATARGRLPEGDELVIARLRSQNVEGTEEAGLEALRHDLSLPGDGCVRFCRCGTGEGSGALLISYYRELPGS